jgi:hypothetical protein
MFVGERLQTRKSANALVAVLSRTSTTIAIPWHQLLIMLSSCERLAVHRPIPPAYLFSSIAQWGLLNPTRVRKLLR